MLRRRVLLSCHHRSRRATTGRSAQTSRAITSRRRASIDFLQCRLAARPYPSGPLPCRDRHLSLPQRAARRRRSPRSPGTSIRSSTARATARRVERLLDEADQRARALRGALRRPRGRARRSRASPRRCTSWARSRTGRPGRHLRGAELLDRHRRPGPRRAAPARAGARHGDRDQAAVRRARVGGARRRARGGAARLRGAGLLPPLPAHPAPLPPAPALGARGAPDEREVGHRAQRVDAAVHRADVGDAGHGRRRGARAAGRRAGTSRLARPRRAPRGRRGGHRGARARACARAPTSTTRCSPTRRPTTACATIRPGWRAATCPTRPPTSPCRRWSRPSARATTFPSAGIASRRRLLGVDRLADYDRAAAVTGERRGHRLAAGARARARLLRVLLARARATSRARFFDEHWIDAPVREHKRGGAFCAYATPSAHPYVLLNYTAKRRDVLTLAHELGHGVHATLAARAGHLPPGHAADDGRDRVGVRRGGHLRAAARARPTRPSRGSRCWPRASRARSRPCSARRP